MYPPQRDCKKNCVNPFSELGGEIKVGGFFAEAAQEICLILLTPQSPVNQGGACWPLRKGVVGDRGFEPVTSTVGAQKEDKSENIRGDL